MYDARDSSPSDAEEPHAQTPRNDVFTSTSLLGQDGYSSTDSASSRRSPTRRKISHLTSETKQQRPPILSGDHVPNLRRRFFPSSMVWDMDRRELLRINPLEGLHIPIPVNGDMDVDKEADIEAEDAEVEDVEEVNDAEPTTGPVGGGVLGGATW